MADSVLGSNIPSVMRLLETPVGCDNVIEALPVVPRLEVKTSAFPPFEAVIPGTLALKTSAQASSELAAETVV